MIIFAENSRRFGGLTVSGVCLTTHELSIIEAKTGQLIKMPTFTIFSSRCSLIAGLTQSAFRNLKNISMKVAVRPHWRFLYLM